ncbi:hypothetical protein AEAC466_20560 [Asticcacaulis sp. AC466]|uniref:MerR family transcriptional regulator n=1 Tax=Asticcacaulis sp. AC466 TaxID=1282362 RepID=UPI0003C4085E|nr:MerR family transcriptional regulator [Asticcacaulis sp. AC466]ESQ81690.1 hypothetical protein AEAC466_20560 [Asticcacaulis sp. AC466]
MKAKSERWFGPNEIAKRLGLSTKALRVYEREGLLHPHRTEAGWRVYGPAHVERLHLILVLRDLGLSLKGIKALIEGRQADLQTVLVVQQESLEAQRKKIDRAIDLLVTARNRLNNGQTLSLDDFINLTRDARMDQRPSPVILKADFETALRDQFPNIANEALAHINQAVADGRMPTKNYAGSKLDTSNGDFTTVFEDMIKEASILMAEGDETSDRAKALARDWNAQSIGLKPAEKSVSEAIQTAFWGTVNDPKSPKSPIFDPEIFRFVATVIKGMKERGEI